MRALLICLLLLTLLTPAAINPLTHKSLIDSGIRLTLDQRYEETLSLFRQAQARYPKDPLLDYYLMLTYEGMMMDYETVEWEARFDTLSQRAETLLKAARTREPRDAWAAYYLGSLYVVRGAHELRFSHYLDFTKSILQGIKLLNAAVGLDSTLYDANIYLGLYQFAKTKLYAFLPQGETDREEALEKVRIAASRSLLSRDFATQVLAGLYGHMGDLGHARALTDSLKIRYPRNRAIRWIYANACLSQKQYVEAGREFDSLKILVNDIPSQYPYNRVSLRVCQADIAWKTGKYRECRDLCDSVMAIPSGKDRRITDLHAWAKKTRVKAVKKS